MESKASINTYFTELEQMLRAISQAHVQDILSLLEETYRNGHRIFIMGNGGSAATASHFALDLAKNTIMPGAPRLKAISLTDHVPLITAWSNDTAYEHIFEEQLANMKVVLVCGAKWINQLERRINSKQSMIKLMSFFTVELYGTVARAMRRRLLAITPKPNQRSIPSSP